MLIVGVYAGLATLLVLVLAMRVMWLRHTRRVGIGTGDVPELVRAIRAHANAVEYVPLGLLLLVLLALEQTPSMWLNVFGSTLLVARLLHAIGLSRHAGTSFGRFVGTGLTVLVLLAMALSLVLHYPPLAALLH